MTLSGLEIHVLVLAVAKDKGTLARAGGDHERDTVQRRIDGDERRRAVVVLARRHPARP